MSPKIDSEMLSTILHGASEAAMAAIKSPQYMEALARMLIREAAINPGGFNRRAYDKVKPEDLLARPIALHDGSVLLLTLFPIDLPTCYTVMLGERAQVEDDHHHHQPVQEPRRMGPTPVGQTRSPVEVVARKEETPFSYIVYNDVPGNAAMNTIVSPTKEENDDLQRQFLELDFKSTRWIYLTKVEREHA